MQHQQLDYWRAVHGLAFLVRLTKVFHANPQARLLWLRYHARQLGKIPRTVVIAENGLETVRGLLVHGAWDCENGWDFRGSFVVLAEDGSLNRVPGWQAVEHIIQ